MKENDHIVTLLQAIREEFKKGLERKTGWGRNEVMSEYDRACNLAAIKYLELNK